MKKFIALLLALVMVLGLVACGGSTPEAETPKDEAPSNVETPESDAAEEVTLTYWLPCNDLEAGAAEQKGIHRSKNCRNLAKSCKIRRKSGIFTVCTILP